MANSISVVSSAINANVKFAQKRNAALAAAPKDVPVSDDLSTSGERSDKFATNKLEREERAAVIDGLSTAAEADEKFRSRRLNRQRDAEVAVPEGIATEVATMEAGAQTSSATDQDTSVVAKAIRDNADMVVTEQPAGEIVNLVPASSDLSTSGARKEMFSLKNPSYQLAEQMNNWYSGLGSDTEHFAATDMTLAEQMEGLGLLLAVAEETSGMSKLVGTDGANALIGKDESVREFMDDTIQLQEHGYSMRDLLNPEMKETLIGEDSVFSDTEAYEAAVKNAEDLYQTHWEGSARASNAYGDFTEDVIANSKKLKGSVGDVAGAYKSLRQSAEKLAKTKGYIDKFKAGDTDKKTLDYIGELLGTSDRDYLKKNRQKIIDSGELD